jgi:hypothetical protein
MVPYAFVGFYGFKGFLFVEDSQFFLFGFKLIDWHVAPYFGFSFGYCDERFVIYAATVFKCVGSLFE